MLLSPYIKMHRVVSISLTLSIGSTFALWHVCKQKEKAS